MNTLLRSLLAVGLLFYSAGIANAQKTVAPQQTAGSYIATQNNYFNGATPADQSGGNVRVLAGCLYRGPGASEYTLRGDGMKTWVLRSDSVYLRTYVDETIRVAVLGNPDNRGTYVVTDILAVITTSCMR